eukprot:8286924-Lingulodinium_polyedra.AAC.1
MRSSPQKRRRPRGSMRRPCGCCQLATPTAPWTGRGRGRPGMAGVPARAPRIARAATCARAPWRPGWFGAMSATT